MKYIREVFEYINLDKHLKTLVECFIYNSVITIRLLYSLLLIT